MEKCTSVAKGISGVSFLALGSDRVRGCVIRLREGGGGGEEGGGYQEGRLGVLLTVDKNNSEEPWVNRIWGRFVVIVCRHQGGCIMEIQTSSFCLVCNFL